MTQKEHQHLIDTILNQQAEILKFKEQINFLHSIIDSLSRELENCRTEGKV